MWLYLVGIVLVVIGILGSLLGGGIFTIALLPVGLVILGSAVGYGLWTRHKAGELGLETEGHPTTTRPLPHSPQRETAHVPTSPDSLADARRVQQ